MNSGIYSALSGNIAAMKRLDVLSNNLANANTPGFKKDRMTFESLLQASGRLPQPQPPTATDAPVFSETVFFTDYSAGPVKQSGNALDLAIDGDGFFVVNTPQGPAYTRQGNFRLDAAGRLVTTDGYEVAGAGAITGGKVEINARGEIFVDGGQVGTLQVVDFPKPYALQKSGNGLFVPANPQAAAPQPVRGEKVRQGFIEDSNVNTVQEMVQLIETNRYFEFCSKVVKAFDDLTGKAANEIGKL